MLTGDYPTHMFAKLFASLYQGTLRGRAHEILVFTNLLAHCDAEGYVDKHFRAIAEEVGLTVDEVKAAIEVLESPDAESRSPQLDGRRLVRADEHRAWGWRVVNHGKYRAIKDEADRREQNRLAQANYRARHAEPASPVSNSKQPSASVSGGQQSKPIQKQSTEAEIPGGGDLLRSRARGATGPAAVAATPPPAEAFGGDESEPEAPADAPAGPPPNRHKLLVSDDTDASRKPPAFQSARKAPAGGDTAKPPKLEGVPGTNKPTLDSALAHFAWVSQTTDERWSPAEVREAYRLFEAAQGPDGNWWWGKRLCGDWRASMTQRMSDQREKRGGKRPAMTAGDALVRAINGVNVSQADVERD